MNYIKDIKLFNKDELDTVNMIIEIEKGSKKKNELIDGAFDKIECVRKIKYRYPFYYGCFPQTLAGDHDPADAILITKKKHKPLDVVAVQPVAIIKTIDNNEEDNKIICIEGEVKHLDKEIEKVLKFLCIYKGKNSNTIVDKNIYDVAEALKCLKGASKIHVAKNQNVNSLKVS